MSGTCYPVGGIHIMYSRFHYRFIMLKAQFTYLFVTVVEWSWALPVSTTRGNARPKLQYRMVSYVYSRGWMALWW